MCDNAVAGNMRGRICRDFFTIALPALLLYSPLSLAAIKPQALPSDVRLGEFIYDVDQIFLVQTAKDIATHIILAPDEKIISSALGVPADCRVALSEWCVVAHVGASELFVQPRTAKPARNNMQLTTNLRRYSFEFVQSATIDKDVPLYRVTFRYAPGGQPPGRSGSLSSPRLAGQSCNWNYSILNNAGAARVAPLAVFDNGRDTFLILPPGNPAPELLAEHGQGRLTTVSGISAGKVMQLAGLHSAFTLRTALSETTISNDGTGSSTGVCPQWL